MVAAAGPTTAEDLKLGMPIACEPGRTCFIQHYVDVAPQAGTADFRCGHSTYKGHDGTDFRILSAAAARQGVGVLATAPGIVKGRRDGMADAFPRETGKEAVKDRECGNGVVIDHGDGWTTQYCHMRRGSVRVVAGAKVERGQVLGEVGYSGLADTAHVHLTVRHRGKAVDPFTAKPPDGSCLREGADGGALFDEAVLRAFPYADGLFLQAGFVTRRVDWSELEADHETAQTVTPTSDMLMFFARISHLRAGDRIEIALKGPGGFDLAAPGTPVDRDKAIYVALAGRSRKAERWPPGLYEGVASLIRDNRVVSKTGATFAMP